MSLQKKRIAEIIRGIANAELRELAGEYIAEAWYDSCENDSGFFGMQDIVGYISVPLKLGRVNINQITPE